MSLQHEMLTLLFYWCFIDCLMVAFHWFFPWVFASNHRKNHTKTIKPISFPIFFSGFPVFSSVFPFFLRFFLTQNKQRNGSAKHLLCFVLKTALNLSCRGSRESGVRWSVFGFFLCVFFFCFFRLFVFRFSSLFMFRFVFFHFFLFFFRFFVSEREGKGKIKQVLLEGIWKEKGSKSSHWRGFLSFSNNKVVLTSSLKTLFSRPLVPLWSLFLFFFGFLHISCFLESLHENHPARHPNQPEAATLFLSSPSQEPRHCLISKATQKHAQELLLAQLLPDVAVGGGLLLAELFSFPSETAGLLLVGRFLMVFFFGFKEVSWD